jgi:hypothetical protein
LFIVILLQETFYSQQVEIPKYLYFVLFHDFFFCWQSQESNTFQKLLNKLNDDNKLKHWNQ